MESETFTQIHIHGTTVFSAASHHPPHILPRSIKLPSAYITHPKVILNYLLDIIKGHLQASEELVASIDYLDGQAALCL